MHSTLRTIATAGGAFAALLGIGATVVALPVPPVRDESQLERASALDRGYGINSFDLDVACRLVPVVIVDPRGVPQRRSIRQCD